MTTAFIFDFDGTLVDSEQGIYQCFQSITKRLAPERMEYTKNILIGPPLRETASQILGPEHQELLDEFIQLFITMHDEQIIYQTKPYPDVGEVLKILHNQNIPMAIATNKRLAPTQKLINHFNWNKYFKIIECSDNKNNIRNKNEMIKSIIEIFSEFKDSYFVGDTVSDCDASISNNLKFIRAMYGFGKNQKWRNNEINKKIISINQILDII